MAFLIWAATLVVAAVGGYYFTKLVLNLAQRRTEHERPPRPESAETGEPGGSAGANGNDGPDSEAAKSGLRGGMWIGILERVLVTSFLMTGQIAGVAVVVAVKSLGRYPELNTSNSERFIVGTMASLLWALFSAWAGTAALHHFL
ncbi:hypothetical protein ACFSYH_03490 [Populibacterium corticicola]|uniref:Uncharacterized protein n=1 Tax=Populibacterium corticicola TaxID=1812826 RepID=A0ABW5XD11_9MICO